MRKKQVPTHFSITRMPTEFRGYFNTEISVSTHFLISPNAPDRKCTWFKIKLTSLCRQWVWGELYQRQTWFEPRWQKSRPVHRRTLQGYQRGKGAWQRGQHLGNNITVLRKTFTIFCSVNLHDTWYQCCCSKCSKNTAAFLPSNVSTARLREGIQIKSFFFRK